MAAPIADFSADHATPGSFPTVTTVSATSTWDTPGRAKSRSTRCEPDARSLLSKKNGPPGCTVRLTVNLHVSGSACDVSARMVVVESMDRTSDIFHNPGCAAFTEGPQVLERVDPRAVTVVPADGDGVVAHAGDRAGGSDGRMALSPRRGSPLPVPQVHANGFSPVVGSPWRRPANSVAMAR